MRICLFGTYFYTYSRNAVLRVGLRRIGVEVVEVHRDTAKRRFESKSDVSLINILSLILEKIQIAASMLTGYKKIQMSDVVVVLYPSFLVFPVAWILSIFFRKKLILDSFTSVYDTMINDRKLISKKRIKSHLVKAYEKLILHLSDKIFVDTKSMRKYISTEFNISQEKIFVIPVGSDDTVYKRSRKVIPGRVTKVIWFGGYSPLQAADCVIQAAKILSTHNSIHFTLVGDGLLKKDIVTFAQNHSLKNVTFIGEIVEKELAKKIRESDIMLGIFANNSMAQRVIPNKVYAGISSGKAVVTGQLPPVKETFTNNKDIIFVKPKNPSDLASKILMLSKNKKMRENIGENGYKLYKEKFTPEKIALKFMENIIK